MTENIKMNSLGELIEEIDRQIQIQGNCANLNHLDVSAVKDMSRLFTHFKNFNGNIAKWDVSNVYTMDSMFQDTKFNQDISTWNTSNVVSTQFMFFDSCFNQDTSMWNLNKAIYTKAMFENSPKLLIFPKRYSHR